MPSRSGYAADLQAMGLEVARLRRERQWSVGHLSGLAGVSARTVVNIESGERSAMVSTLYAVARALQVDLADLVRLL